MNKQIMKSWVTALRSGEYEQGQGSLRDSDQFCCLGVLCNLHAQAHPEIAAAQHNLESYLGARDFLPKKVQKWAGMRTNNGSLRAPVGRHQIPEWQHQREESFSPSLAGHNDNDVIFDDIATIIEENWERL